jgi:uncharacterized protein YbcI
VSGDGILRDGELALAISTAVDGELARTTGRGPMRAKTMLADSAVFVVLQDTVTRGEHNLEAPERARTSRPPAGSEDPVRT